MTRRDACVQTFAGECESAAGLAIAAGTKVDAAFWLESKGRRKRTGGGRTKYYGGKVSGRKAGDGEDTYPRGQQAGKYSYHIMFDDGDKQWVGSKYVSAEPR